MHVQVYVHVSTRVLLQMSSEDGDDSVLIAVDNETVDEGSKYRISGYYNLTVRNLDLDDDGWIKCTLGVDDNTAKLTVSGETRQYTMRVT